jgi:hypothetical protein
MEMLADTDTVTEGAPAANPTGPPVLAQQPGLPAEKDGAVSNFLSGKNCLTGVSAQSLLCFQNLP